MTAPPTDVRRPDGRPAALVAEAALAVSERVRREAPRVHCLTNSVVEGFTANVLLAAGAVPSMTADPDEVPEFVAGARALLVNLGTLDGSRRRSVHAALAAGRARGIPWVLDPVMVDRSRRRRAFALECLQAAPAVLRANGAEVDALAPALHHARVIARTGDPDCVSRAGAAPVLIRNGAPMMAQVTGVGCAASALVAACLAVEPAPAAAAVAALLWMAVAGERAASGAPGPGTFAAALLDELHRLDAAGLAAAARVESPAGAEPGGAGQA